MKMKMLFKAVAVNIIAINSIKSANAGSVVYVLNFFFPGEVLCSQLEESEDVNFNDRHWALKYDFGQVI